MTDAELPYSYSCSRETLASLKPGVLDAFAECALKYKAATGQVLEITSAHRSLRHCAQLMNAFSQEQLEAMYCRNGYPDYIRKLVQARHEKGRALTDEEAYRILCDRSEGYISAHLYGAALDIAADSLLDKALLQELLKKAGFRTLDETNLGICCIHASYSGIAAEIIKE